MLAAAKLIEAWSEVAAPLAARWDITTNDYGVELNIKGWRFPKGAINTRDFRIFFTRRPHYCDRGRWMVYNEAPGLDFADGWPRYYFDTKVAASEVYAWLQGREEMELDATGS